MAKSETIFYDHHIHSLYSLNDAIIKIPDLVKRCKEMGRDSVTITDHGTLAAIFELYQECEKEKMKPVVGIEAYYVDNYESEEMQEPYNYAHMILLAKNEQGWRNLKELQSIAWELGHLKKPRMSWKFIEKYHEGLICTTACFRGLVGWDYFKFLEGENEEKFLVRLKERVSNFHNIFGEDFYLEVQFNEIKGQDVLNKYLLKLGKKYRIKIVAAGDCHYMNRMDYKYHDIAICNFRRKLLSDEDNGTYNTHMIYVKDANQMKNAWEAYHDHYMTEEQFWDSIKTSVEINDKIEKYPIKPKELCLPLFTKTPKENMVEWVERGLKEKLPDKVKDKIYRERLDYEFAMFDKLGMHGYMLICADIIREAKARGIPIGPGRGSVCGSLIAFCMDITQIDPIRFNTSFDRFLNADRLSLPDIDMDFGKDQREEIKDYVRKKYGIENFAAIANYTEWKPRGLIKDIGRVLGRPYIDMDRITKQIDDKTTKFEDEEHPLKSEVIWWLNENKDISDPALHLQGIYRARGIHASGMILTPTRLENWVPVAYMTERDSEEKKPIKVSEWDMYSCEDAGILKIDFLGLTTLDVIYDTVKLINGYKHIAEVNIINDIWEKILKDLDNAEVYETICQCNLLGMFQLETSEGMHELIKRMQPVCFNDIVMAISLYRTAVIQAGMLDEYLKRREGESFEYIHPIIEPVLKNTFGIMVFQESLMEIGVVAGGMTKQQSDNFRKATKLKDPEKFKKWKDTFVEGCRKNGLTDDEGATLWDWCLKFAGYGFSVNHATAYSLITYTTAWLKTYYPSEFMTSLMSHNIENSDMMAKYLSECGRLKLKIKNPNINKSSDNFLLSKSGKIMMPLTLINSFGDKAYQAIITEKEKGEFESFEDFYERIDKRVLNVRIVSNMILANCFGSLENSIEETFDKYIELRGKDKVSRQCYCLKCQFRYPCSLSAEESEGFICPNCGNVELAFDDETCKGKKFNRSFISAQVFGFSVGENPLKRYVKQIEESNADSLDILDEVEENYPVGVAIFVKRIKKHIDKKGNEMAFVGISDGNRDCDLTIFSSDWEELKEKFQIGCCYLVVAFKNRGTNLLFNTRARPKSKLIQLGM